MIKYQIENHIDALIKDYNDIKNALKEFYDFITGRLDEDEF